MEHKFMKMSENNHYLDLLESDIEKLTSRESINLLQETLMRLQAESISHSLTTRFSFSSIGIWFNNLTKPRYIPSQRNVLIENIALKSNLTLLADAPEIGGLEALTNQYDNLFQEVIQESKSLIVSIPITELTLKSQSQEFSIEMLVDELDVMLEKIEMPEEICRGTMHLISAIISRFIECITKEIVTKCEIESKYIFFMHHINGFSPKYHFMEFYQLNFILIINYSLASKLLNLKAILSLYIFVLGGRMRF